MSATWWRFPGEREAHAFTEGPGWLRASCGLRWTVRLVRVDRVGRRCPECAAGVPVGAAMSEGEAREAFGA
jgi:hypothetical protein